MKLFKSLLVAPATLGLLAPMTATANELNLNDVSGYSSSEEIQNISEFNPAEELAVTNSRVDGLEARFNNFEAGGFSETTTASFGVDMLLSAVDEGKTYNADGSAVTGNFEKLGFDYQMGIGLETSFTGEDSLSATIDIGNGSTAGASADGLNFDSTGDQLTLDGLTYTFPVGGATVMVGDNTDISAVYSGACAYSAFTDYMGNCGTGNSVGVGGNGATAAMSYAFDGGFTLAGGISSTPTSIMTQEGTDTFGIEAAYAGDSYAVSVAYSDTDLTTSTTYWGINATYAFDFATLSAGIETADAEGSDTATGFMVGLSFAEVGPGSLDIGMGTTGNFKDSDPEYYIYEASYAYPVNDGVTITPGVYVREQAGDDQTGIAVKTSFSF
jgi:hypothetical protein